MHHSSLLMRTFIHGSRFIMSQLFIFILQISLSYLFWSISDLLGKFYLLQRASFFQTFEGGTNESCFAFLIDDTKEIQQCRTMRSTFRKIISIFYQIPIVVFWMSQVPRSLHILWKLTQLDCFRIWLTTFCILLLWHRSFRLSSFFVVPLYEFPCSRSFS